MNNFFIKEYEEESTLHIELFDNHNKLIKKHDFTLSKGTDSFDGSGLLHHDKFIGAVFAMQAGETIRRRL